MTCQTQACKIYFSFLVFPLICLNVLFRFLSNAHFIKMCRDIAASITPRAGTMINGGHLARCNNFLRHNTKAPRSNVKSTFSVICSISISISIILNRYSTFSRCCLHTICICLPYYSSPAHLSAIWRSNINTLTGGRKKRRNVKLRRCGIFYMRRGFDFFNAGALGVFLRSSPKIANLSYYRLHDHIHP